MELHTHHIWTEIRGVIPWHILTPVTSYLVPGRWFSEKYKKGFWDGREHYIAYDKKTKTYWFPTGLLESVCNALDTANYKYTLLDNRVYNEYEPQYILNHKTLGSIDLREGIYSYQSEALEAALFKKRGIIQLGTGGGKTETAAAIVKSIIKFDGSNTGIWITHRTNLAYQTKARLEERLQRKIGFIGDQTFDFQDFTVCMVQTIADAKNKGYNDTAEFIKGCELLIGDELHHAESESWFETIINCGAAYKIGLSATPNLTGSGLSLLALTGGILYQKSPLELIELGVCVPPRIWMCEYEAEAIPAKTPYQTVYSEGIVHNANRNMAIANVSHMFRQERKPTLTLVKRINHGKMLADLFCYKGIKTEFVYSKVDQTTRDQYIEKLCTGQIHNIIAVAETMGEGTDIPGLEAVINATGSSNGGNKEDGETGRQLIQFLGRGMRRGSRLDGSPKTYFDYVDIIDTQHKSLRDATDDRLATLQAEKYDAYINTWQNYIPSLV